MIDQFLKFVHENSELCSIIAGAIGAVVGGLASAWFTLWRERAKDKKESIKELRQEKAQLQQRIQEMEKELKVYQDVAKQEATIDKSKGTLYIEKLSGGRERNICGFCWEKDHKTIPINAEAYHVSSVEWGESGKCSVCQRFCKRDNVDDLPF